MLNILKKDLRDINNCFEVCEGQDYIYHIAGIKGSPVITKTKQYTFFTSLLQMNTNMLAAMYASNMKWGVYTSTVGTYGQADVFREDELWEKNPLQMIGLRDGPKELEKCK